MPARLGLVGASASDPAAVNNRPPLAQTFAASNGERFTLVVNHLNSQRGCPAAGDANAAGNTDAGDGQGCWNARRLRQAAQLRTFVAKLQAGSASNDVLLVGDFNAYAREDPIDDLTSRGYVDQSARFETLGYSYVFDGAAGRLDHAITTATLSAKVTGAAHWHIDADESLQHDYNLEFRKPACATCAPDPYDGTLPYRASDHDPVLIGLNLARPSACASDARASTVPVSLSRPCAALRGPAR
jgi:predicted extracellular nuclease